jgi:hypothetical protein
VFAKKIIIFGLMVLDGLQTVDIIEAMENFLEMVRPSEDVRPQLDISYKIEGQSVFVLEIRPQFGNKQLYREYAVAKATYVRSENIWKVFWMRANLKWYSYLPQPVVGDIKEFAKLVREDKHHCFWG